MNRSSRILERLLADTDRPVLLALQGCLVLAVGACLLVKAEARQFLRGSA